MMRRVSSEDCFFFPVAGRLYSFSTIMMSEFSTLRVVCVFFYFRCLYPDASFLPARYVCQCVMHPLVSQRCRRPRNPCVRTSGVGHMNGKELEGVTLQAAWECSSSCWFSSCPEYVHVIRKCVSLPRLASVSLMGQLPKSRLCRLLFGLFFFCLNW